LGIVTFGSAFVYHFARGNGLLANARASEAVKQAHTGSFIPKIGADTVRRLLGGDAVFIDARLEPAYEAGHLERAINLPVDANDVERRKVTAAVPEDAKVVVYCQSATCPWARNVAVKLLRDGFIDVSIFRGGWNEWASKHVAVNETDS
jgi:rhodanese-related sulfurtransferase